ncbi:hypothetical protein L1887_57778 [Cichorium endivia]|nr:hypothetical protein L1887_57778 [Cichorium endivia]
MQSAACGGHHPISVRTRPRLGVCPTSPAAPSAQARDSGDKNSFRGHYKCSLLLLQLDLFCNCALRRRRRGHGLRKHGLAKVAAQLFIRQPMHLAPHGAHDARERTRQVEPPHDIRRRDEHEQEGKVHRARNHRHELVPAQHGQHAVHPQRHLRDARHGRPLRLDVKRIGLLAEARADLGLACLAEYDERLCKVKLLLLATVYCSLQLSVVLGRRELHCHRRVLGLDARVQRDERQRLVARLAEGTVHIVFGLPHARRPRVVVPEAVLEAPAQPRRQHTVRRLFVHLGTQTEPALAPQRRQRRRILLFGAVEAPGLAHVRRLGLLERAAERHQHLVPHLGPGRVERHLDRLANVLLERALDLRHHLLGLLDAHRIRDRLDLGIQLRHLLVHGPVRLGQQHRVGRGAELGERGALLAAHHVAEIVVGLGAHAVEHAALEVLQHVAVQILELAQEERRERAVELFEQVDALALVHLLVVSARVAVEAGERRGAMQRHISAERVEDGAAFDVLAEVLDGGGEERKRSVGDLVAAELGEELLLGGEVEVLVGHDLLPDGLEVVRKAVGGDALVVLGLEDKVGVLVVDKAGAQRVDGLVELDGLEHLVRERGEHEVEEVGDLRRLEAFWLCEREPDLGEIGHDGGREILERCDADVVADDEEQQRLVLCASGLCLACLEEAEVDLEHGLEEAHVGALVEAHLVFPEVDDEHLCRSHGEERRLALKVLILAAFAAVGALDVHDENVHLEALAHPNALGGLLACGLAHDVKVGAEELVEQRRLARRLRAEHGAEVVAKAGIGHCMRPAALDDCDDETRVLAGAATGATGATAGATGAGATGAGATWDAAPFGALVAAVMGSSLSAWSCCACACCSSCSDWARSCLALSTLSSMMSCEYPAAGYGIGNPGAKVRQGTGTGMCGAVLCCDCYCRCRRRMADGEERMERGSDGGVGA